MLSRADVLISDISLLLRHSLDTPRIGRTSKGERKLGNVLTSSEATGAPWHCGPAHVTHADPTRNYAALADALLRRPAPL